MPLACCTLGEKFWSFVYTLVLISYFASFLRLDRGGCAGAAVWAGRARGARGFLSETRVGDHETLCRPFKTQQRARHARSSKAHESHARHTRPCSGRYRRFGMLLWWASPERSAHTRHTDTRRSPAESVTWALSCEFLWLCCRRRCLSCEPRVAWLFVAQFLRE